MADCFAAAAAFLSSCVYYPHFSQIMQQVKSFWVRLRQPLPPLLPLTNTDSHSSMQNLPMLKLGMAGKLVFPIAFTAIFGLLFTQLNLKEDHHLIIVGFMISCMLVYNGVVFAAINTCLGNFLQLIGMSLIMCLLCVLVGTFLPTRFSVACWVCAAFCLTPFLYILIKPHAGS